MIAYLLVPRRDDDISSSVSYNQGKLLHCTEFIRTFIKKTRNVNNRAIIKRNKTGACR